MSGATATAIAVGVATAAAGAVASRLLAPKQKTPSFQTASAEKVIDPNVARKATSRLEKQGKAAAVGTRFAGSRLGQSTSDDGASAPTRRARLLGGSASV